MAENPQRPVTAVRPLSPHLTIYRWPVTMMTSITHRATGVALSLGMLVLAWWLVSISNGPEGWESFQGLINTPVGLLIIFALTVSMCFHFFNGIRHLAWDLGYGFTKSASHSVSIGVIAASGLATIAIYVLVWSGHAGYLR